MMLSRVAERMYWMGRQIERVEDTARLLNTNINLLLDSPLADVEKVWRRLIGITGNDETFNSHYNKRDERNVVKFLIADTHNPSSLVSSMRFVRENARTTREIIPVEAWEQINDLYLYVSQHASDSLSRKKRVELLSHVVPACQMIYGILAGAMRHDAAYRFFRLGLMLERADMTSRILNVGTAPMPVEDSGEVQLDVVDNSAVWMNVLNSLSAYQAYQQYVGQVVSEEEVAAFVIQDRYFPRSINACLCRFLESLDELPNNTKLVKLVMKQKKQLDNLDIHSLMGNGAYNEFVDVLQGELNKIAGQVDEIWFRFGD